MIEERSLLSRASDEVHTSQLHAMTGTPCDVPVPKNVTVMLIFDGRKIHRRLIL
jgi:hypothetical protein